MQEQLPAHISGLTVRAPIALGCDGALAATPATVITDEVLHARLRDLENRQLMAVQRLEREAATEVRALTAELDKLGVDERHVIQTLSEHGYLRER